MGKEEYVIKRAHDIISCALKIDYARLQINLWNPSHNYRYFYRYRRAYLLH